MRGSGSGVARTVLGAAAVALTLLGMPIPAGAQDSTYAIESFSAWVTAPNGNPLYTRIVRPVLALYPGRRFPTVIAIPGGTGAGAPLAGLPSYRNFAARGSVVAAFNPEGRGTGLPGNLRSGGAEDCNGFTHQDDLKAVVQFLAALPGVDTTNIGVESLSFGIAIAAGCLGRYPDLPVSWLVDGEGPHDSRVITFFDVGRETAVCGHLSLVSDPSAPNEAFWAQREAVRHIGGFRGRYLRMQAEIDHAQGAGYFRHAVEMVAAAARPRYGGAGAARWARMNGDDLGNLANTVYALEDTLAWPAWINGRMADHPGLAQVYDREMAALAAQPLRLSAVPEAVDGQTFCRLTLRGVPGETWDVEASADRALWSVIRTQTLAGDSWSFLDENPAAPPRRFYRALLAP